MFLNVNLAKHIHRFTLLSNVSTLGKLNLKMFNLKWIVVATVLLVVYLVRRHMKQPIRRPPPSLRGTVLSVCKSSEHVFSKIEVDEINLIENLGVQGDCHLGKTVQHRSRLHITPAPLNLRQVHLIHSELFDEFRSHNKDGHVHHVKPGDLGENITTVGLDLLAFGVGTKLRFVNPDELESEGTSRPTIRVTGLRNPCPQIQKFQNGLQEKCLVRDAYGDIVKRKAGIMCVVEVGGVVKRGAYILVEVPQEYAPLPCV